MNNSWSRWRHQQRQQKKASKKIDQTHLTYCWLRADQASVQLNQLARSHKITSVCLDDDRIQFEGDLETALNYIESVKSLISNYREVLKK